MNRFSTNLDIMDYGEPPDPYPSEEEEEQQYQPSTGYWYYYITRDGYARLDNLSYSSSVCECLFMMRLDKGNDVLVMINPFRVEDKNGNLVFELTDERLIPVVMKAQLIPVDFVEADPGTNLPF